MRAVRWRMWRVPYQTKIVHSVPFLPVSLLASALYMLVEPPKKKKEKIAFALVSTRRAAVSRKDLFSRG